jgi:hypothetical protein
MLQRIRCSCLGYQLYILVSCFGESENIIFRPEARRETYCNGFHINC